MWLDFAAFYIIQATPSLNRFGWGSFAVEWQNAGIHFVAVVLAGVLLDGGWLRWLLCFAYVCLALAAACLSGLMDGMWLTHWFYATGVSLYSTALVFVPALAPRAAREERKPTPRIAAVGRARGNQPGPALGGAAVRSGFLYAVAGWVGSALGIGMAQDLHLIPTWFVVLAGAVVLACAPSPEWWVAFVNRRAGTGLLGLFLVGFFYCSTRALPKDHLSSAPVNAQTGREVYIAEGCMHCHSQFVRKGTADEQWWGPWMEPREILKTRPPLIGNRRQGQDLLNVGNRRSPEWNRLHLMDPRSLSPGSRMPSYAALFSGEDHRGPTLLEYLASLGRDSFAERMQDILAWRPGEDAFAGEVHHPRGLYEHLCSQCHGVEGRGDGPLSSQIAGAVRPRDLVQGEWIFYARGASNSALELARTIKFGVPGTSMPGHEQLEDSELLGLAAFVQSLKAH